MTNMPGEWIWFELLTSDADAAQAFYTRVVGWSVAPFAIEGGDYRIVSAPDGVGVGGVMTKPQDMAGGARWLGYIGVDDVDASIAAIERLGGAVHLPATDVPDVGRMALLADPQGCAFHVMRGASDQPSRAFAQGQDTIGHVVWCELSSPDPDAAIAFYSVAFGWGQDGAMPMGDLGDYRFLQAGATGFGAVMKVMAEGSEGWLFYFHVPDIDAAADRLRGAGGRIVQEPVEIPGGGHSLVAIDPQGAAFGLVGQRAGDAATGRTDR